MRGVLGVAKGCGSELPGRPSSHFEGAPHREALTFAGHKSAPMELMGTHFRSSGAADAAAI